MATTTVTTKAKRSFLTAMVDDETIASLKRISKRKEDPVSKLIRLALRQFIEREGKS